MKHLQNIFFLLLITSALSASEQQNIGNISNPSDKDIDIRFFETKYAYASVPPIIKWLLWIPTNIASQSAIGKKTTVKTDEDIQIPHNATSVAIVSRSIYQCGSSRFHPQDDYPIDAQSSYSLMGLDNKTTLLINDANGEAAQTGEQQCFKKLIKKLVKEPNLENRSTLLIKDAT